MVVCRCSTRGEKCSGGCSLSGRVGSTSAGPVASAPDLAGPNCNAPLGVRPHAVTHFQAKSQRGTSEATSPEQSSTGFPGYATFKVCPQQRVTIGQIQKTLCAEPAAGHPIFSAEHETPRGIVFLVFRLMRRLLRRRCRAMHPPRARRVHAASINVSPPAGVYAHAVV